MDQAAFCSAALCSCVGVKFRATLRSRHSYDVLEAWEVHSTKQTEAVSQSWLATYHS